MSASLIATIVVAALLILLAFLGYRKGLLRILLTTMALILTIVAAGVLVPWFSGVVGDSFIGKNIEKRISGYLENTISSPAINSMSKEQDALIDQLPLPSFIREDISENNTAEEYVNRKVTDFTSYLETRLVTIANKAIAYLILSVLIYVILRILMRIGKVVNRIPIVGGINRFFGGIIGLAEGLLIVWGVCFLIMLIAETTFGIQAVKVINENAFLRLLYDHNGILLGVHALFHSLL